MHSSICAKDICYVDQLLTIWKCYQPPRGGETEGILPCPVLGSQ